MALVTVHAVIDITLHARMPRVCGRLRVAVRALKNGVVTRIGVAGGTNAVSVAVVHREPGMVKRRAGPSHGGVTGGAGCCEYRGRRRVHRIGGGEIVGFMAAVAVGRQRRVVVVHMTAGAGHRRVRAGQRKCCGVVIECPVGPQCGVVAELASRRESHLNVVDWRGCVIVIVQMARNARCISAGQVVIIVDVAIGADTRGNRVGIGQGKSRRGVIELPVGPNHRVVTAFTGRWEG